MLHILVIVCTLLHWTLLQELDQEELGYSLPADTLLEDGDEFDYLVVGAGAGGSAVAARLALAGADVLLVEAGGNPNLLTRVPGAAMSLLGSNLDWQYKTVPNNVSCLSSAGRRCRFSRGKCLGGSTSINYMMYTRGNRRDYDELGLEGWSWKDLKPYFLRYEGLQDLTRLPTSSFPYHNTTGIMKIEHFGDTGNSLHPRIFAGLESLNIPLNLDVNAESQIGVSQVVGYTYKGERMSTARAYLADEEVKKKLKVSKFTKCTGVVIDNNKVARGVTVSKGSLIKRNLTLYARREVVLSAGTIGTPQLLMLSGIGPAEHLKELGLHVYSDLPVGSDMSDHVLPLVVIKVDRGFDVDVPPLTFIQDGVQLVRWVAARDGPLATIGLTDVTAFVNTRCYDFKKRQLVNDRAECELPTLQLINAYIDQGTIPAARPVVRRAMGLNDDIVEQLSEANAGHGLIIASPVVLRPYSRGEVRLASANPFDDPAIHANYLSDERDVEEMLRSITLLEHLTETAALRERNASVLHLRLAGCPPRGAGRAPYWRCYARHMTHSVFHAVGTAPLGRVAGARRLRVGDLSALPLLPRGNTAAAALALGERLADFLLEDAHYLEESRRFGNNLPNKSLNNEFIRHSPLHLLGVV